MFRWNSPRSYVNNLARNLYLASKFVHPVWIVRVVQDGIGMAWTKVSDEQIFGNKSKVFHLDHLPVRELEKARLST